MTHVPYEHQGPLTVKKWRCEIYEKPLPLTIAGTLLTDVRRFLRNLCTYSEFGSISDNTNTMSYPRMYGGVNSKLF